jgi:hypothetical protein
MKGRCIYLQVSLRPYTGSIGFSTNTYLYLTVQTFEQSSVAYKHLITYLQKGVKKTFHHKEWGRKHGSIGVRTGLSVCLTTSRSESRIHRLAHLAVVSFTGGPWDDYLGLACCVP